jgi:hypothetical protein
VRYFFAIICFHFFNLSFSYADIAGNCNPIIGYVVSSFSGSSLAKKLETIPEQQPVVLSRSPIRPHAGYWERVRKGETLSYVIFDHGVFGFVNAKDFDLAKQIASGSVVTTPAKQHFIVEAGELKFDSTKKSFLLDTQFELFKSTAHEKELRLASIYEHLKKSRDYSKENPKFEWIRHSDNPDKTTVIRCQDVFASQTRGDHYPLKRVLVDFGVLSGTILMRDPERLSKPETHDLLAFQLGSSVLSSAFAGLVGRRLINSEWHTGKQLSVRMGLTLASVAIQGGFGAAILDDSESGDSGAQRAASLGLANLIWSFPSLVKGHYVDKLLLRQSPRWMHNLCLMNSKLSFIVGPGFLRIAEKVGANYLYFSWMSFFSGEEM